jgi:hypothetical protein
LLEATAGWWRIGQRERTKAKYAFCVVKGVVREVYRIGERRQRQKGDRDWQNDIGKTPRWGSGGEIADELAHYRNHSVRHLYRNGDRNEIRYINLDQRLPPLDNDGHCSAIEYSPNRSVINMSDHLCPVTAGAGGLIDDAWCFDRLMTP